MQLVGLRDDYRRFQEAGAEVVAVSVETLEVSTSLLQSQHLLYPVLADPEHRVIEAYGVYNLLGDGRAAPAVFVINERGVVVWKYVGRDANDRPGNDAILAHIHDHPT